jgi:uncharacterized DUF497 family protein
MTQKIAGFDWDDGNIAKCRKHGVPLADIEAVFMAGPDVAPDMKHSGDEQRFIAIGKDKAGRPLFVAFTFREYKGATFIRPISARYMHEKEIRAYETRTQT